MTIKTGIQLAFTTQYSASVNIYHANATTHHKETEVSKKRMIGTAWAHITVSLQSALGRAGKREKLKLQIYTGHVISKNKTAAMHSKYYFWPTDSTFEE